MPHKLILRFAKLGGIVLPFLDSSNQNLNQETSLWCVFGGVGGRLADWWRGGGQRSGQSSAWRPLDLSEDDTHGIWCTPSCREYLGPRKKCPEDKQGVRDKGRKLGWGACSCLWCWHLHYVFSRKYALWSEDKQSSNRASHSHWRTRVLYIQGFEWAGETALGKSITTTKQYVCQQASISFPLRTGSAQINETVMSCPVLLLGGVGLC